MGIWDSASPGTAKASLSPGPAKKITVTQDTEEKLFFMYAKDMTENDIKCHMRQLYSIEIYDSTISRIADKIFPVVKEWYSTAHRAGTVPRRNLRGRIHGRDPLPYPSRRAY